MLCLVQRVRDWESGKGFLQKNRRNTGEAQLFTELHELSLFAEQDRPKGQWEWSEEESERKQMANSGKACLSYSQWGLMLVMVAIQANEALESQVVMLYK